MGPMGREEPLKRPADIFVTVQKKLEISLQKYFPTKKNILSFADDVADVPLQFFVEFHPC